MNEHLSNPEHTPPPSYNPHVDTGTQQPQANPNPQSNPHPQAGNPGASQPNPGQPNPGQPNPGQPNPGQPNSGGFAAGGQQSQQTGPQQPPPNPKQLAEDAYAADLKQAWDEFQEAKEAADALGKRGDINLEVIAKIKQNASDELSKKIAEATARFSKQVKDAEFQEQQQSAFSSSQHANPQSSSKLYRSESDKMIAGVCGGLAEYFGIDSSWIRIIFVVLAFVGVPISPFLALFAYIAFAVILPVKTHAGEFRRMF